MSSRSKRNVKQVVAETPPWRGPWDYRCYVDEKGNNIIIDWLRNLSPKARQNLKRTLEQLATKPRDAWSRPQASPLGDHIYVIHFRDENRTQWRIYGEHDDGHKCFVLTNFGTERGGQYDPPSADCSATAKRRMVDVRKSWGVRTCSCLSASNGAHGATASHLRPPGLAH